MSKFKVGDEVVLIHLDKKGIVVKYHPDYNSSPYRVYVPDYDDTCLVSEIALRLVNHLITVYAVCDEKGEIINVNSIFLDRNQAVALSKIYYELDGINTTIRPFALTPINE